MKFYPQKKSRHFLLIISLIIIFGSITAIPFSQNLDESGIGYIIFVLVVLGVNDAPIATADSFTVNEGSTTNLNLAGNDTDADDDQCRHRPRVEACHTVSSVACTSTHSLSVSTV